MSATTACTRDSTRQRGRRRLPSELLREIAICFKIRPRFIMAHQMFQLQRAKFVELGMFGLYMALEYTKWRKKFKPRAGEKTIMELDIEELQKFFYHMEDGQNRRLTIAVSGKRALTYHHGAMSSIAERTEVVLFNIVDPTLTKNAIVHFKNEGEDFIVLELIGDETFPNYPASLMAPRLGQPYLSVGRQEKLWSATPGSIRLILGDGTFVIGSGKCIVGDSGSGVFDSDANLLGIIVGRKQVRVRVEDNPDDMDSNLKEAASHYAEAVILRVPISTITDYRRNMHEAFADYDKDDKPEPADENRKRLAKDPADTQSSSSGAKRTKGDDKSGVVE